MIKVYFPDKNNNIWVVDANGFNVHIKCIDDEDCRCLCNRLNEVEKYDKYKDGNKHSRASR